MNRVASVAERDMLVRWGSYRIGGLLLTSCGALGVHDVVVEEKRKYRKVFGAVDRRRDDEYERRLFIHQETQT